MEVDVGQLAARRTRDLEEDESLVLELHAVGEEAREVERGEDPDRDGSDQAPAHSRPSRSASGSHHTIQSASRPMRRDIFDSPVTRSTNRIGISWIELPRRQAR